MKALVTVSILFSIVAVLFCAVPVVNQWERSAGYPYGRMCNSVFTGFVDTCPANMR